MAHPPSDLPRTYLDAATAAPLHPVARAAWEAALADGWADPARLYAEGRQARRLLDVARESLAGALGCRPDELVLTASGPQAAHLALLGARTARQRVGSAVVASAVEHSAVLQAAAADTVRVPVDALGRVELDAWKDAVQAAGVAVAALQSANGEVGTVQPVTAAAAAAAAAGVPLHVDATASVGNAPVPAEWSLLTADARVWGGPPGVGVLAVRTGTRWRRPWPPDDTVALPAVLAAAAALEARRAELPAAGPRLFALVDRIRSEVPRRVPDVEVVGDPVDRLPHVVTFSCLYVEGEPLLHALDAAGFAVSSGSACTASTLEPSHVLAAMGALTSGNVRVSLHPGVTAADVERFLDALPPLVADLRRSTGVETL